MGSFMTLVMTDAAFDEAKRVAGLAFALIVLILDVDGRVIGCHARDYRAVPQVYDGPASILEAELGAIAFAMNYVNHQMNLGGPVYFVTDSMPANSAVLKFLKGDFTPHPTLGVLRLNLLQQIYREYMFAKWPATNPKFFLTINAHLTGDKWEKAFYSFNTNNCTNFSWEIFTWIRMLNNEADLLAKGAKAKALELREIAESA